MLLPRHSSSNQYKFFEPFNDLIAYLCDKSFEDDIRCFSDEPGEHMILLVANITPQFGREVIEPWVISWWKTKRHKCDQLSIVHGSSNDLLDTFFHYCDFLHYDRPFIVDCNKEYTMIWIPIAAGEERAIFRTLLGEYNVLHGVRRPGKCDGSNEVQTSRHAGSG